MALARRCEHGSTYTGPARLDVCLTGSRSVERSLPGAAWSALQRSIIHGLLKELLAILALGVLARVAVGGMFIRTLAWVMGT